MNKSGNDPRGILRKESYCDFKSQTLSDNGQIRCDANAITFWNQGNTECKVGNFRLAAAKLNVITGLLEGGESFSFTHPTGKMIMSTFSVVFTPGSNPAGSTAFNNLTVQMLVDLD